MSARLSQIMVVLLFFAFAACGEGTGTSPTTTPVSTPTQTVEPTATLPPTPTPTEVLTPTPAYAAPLGIERLTDPMGDVTDTRCAPFPDAPQFVDLISASLEINANNLVLTIDSAGAIPQPLDPGEVMNWALEIDPSGVADPSLYRMTETLSGSTWSTTNYDFDHDGRIVPAKVNAQGNELSISVPLLEFPKIDGPFRWWVATFRNQYDAASSCGDRIPNGDPAWFPADAEPIPMTWEEIPEEMAPAGLGSISLPSDDAGATALLAAMPDNIAGAARSPEDERGDTGLRVVVYGAETGTPFASMSLMEIDAANPFNEFPVGISGRDVIELFTSGIDIIDDAGRDGELGWVRLHVHESLPNGGATRVIQAIVWADANSSWYFAADADSSERLDALLAAFVTAAQSRHRVPLAVVSQ